MSHTSSAVFAITVFAAPVVALGVVLAKTGGASRRTVARVGSLAATAVSVLVTLALLSDLPPDPDLSAIATMIPLSFVPAVPWLLLRDDKPGEMPLVLSLLVSGALVVVISLIGLVTTFGATVAEATNIGAGPGGLFVLLPAGAYVALELKVFRAVQGMLKGLEAETPPKPRPRERASRSLHPRKTRCSAFASSAVARFAWDRRTRRAACASRVSGHLCSPTMAGFA